MDVPLLYGSTEGQWRAIYPTHHLANTSWTAETHAGAKERHFNIMDSKAFPELHRLLNLLFRNLHSQGVGTDKEQVQVIGFDEERQLWIVFLSTVTQQGLLNAVFYHNGLNLTLRGGDEHRCLKLSQMVIKLVPDPDDPSK